MLIVQENHVGLQSLESKFSSDAFESGVWTVIGHLKVTSMWNNLREIKSISCQLTRFPRFLDSGQSKTNPIRVNLIGAG